MITINSLSIRLQGKEILQELTLSLQEKEIHGIVGLNGAGKTTLLNAIFGRNITAPSAVQINGRPLERKMTGFLTSENYFYPLITAREYIRLFSKKQGADIQSWQELLNLPMDELIEKYSTGMKKKLAFLAIILQDRPVLLLDEPFNGLDMESCYIISMIIERLKEQGKTIIITSHIFESLSSICDHLHYLDQGKIAQSFRKDEFHILEKILCENVRNRSTQLIKELLK